MQGMRVWSLPVHYSLTVDDLVASQKLVGRSVGRSVGDRRSVGRQPEGGAQFGKATRPHPPRHPTQV